MKIVILFFACIALPNFTSGMQPGLQPESKPVSPPGSPPPQSSIESSRPSASSGGLQPASQPGSKPVSPPGSPPPQSSIESSRPTVSSGALQPASQPGSKPGSKPVSPPGSPPPQSSIESSRPTASSGAISPAIQLAQASAGSSRSPAKSDEIRPWSPPAKSSGEIKQLSGPAKSSDEIRPWSPQAKSSGEIKQLSGPAKSSGVIKPVTKPAESSGEIIPWVLRARLSDEFKGRSKKSGPIRRVLQTVQSFGGCTRTPPTYGDMPSWSGPVQTSGAAKEVSSRSKSFRSVSFEPPEGSSLKAGSSEPSQDSDWSIMVPDIIIKEGLEVYVKVSENLVLRGVLMCGVNHPVNREKDEDPYGYIIVVTQTDRYSARLETHIDHHNGKSGDIKKDIEAACTYTCFIIGRGIKDYKSIMEQDVVREVPTLIYKMPRSIIKGNPQGKIGLSEENRPDWVPPRC